MRPCAKSTDGRVIARRSVFRRQSCGPAKAGALRTSPASPDTLECFRRFGTKSQAGAEQIAVLANFENEDCPFSLSVLRQVPIPTVFAVRFRRYRKPERSSHDGCCIPSDHRGSPPSHFGNPLLTRPPGSSAGGRARGSDPPVRPPLRLVPAGERPAPAEILCGLGRRGKPRPVLRLQRTEIRRNPLERLAGRRRSDRLT